SREAAKHGFSPAELPGLVERLKSFKRIHIEGLMTMAALTDDAAAARPALAELRRLRDRLCDLWGEPGVLQHLSMGMPHDFEAASAPGATLVRLASALFEGLVPS